LGFALHREHRPATLQKQVRRSPWISTHFLLQVRGKHIIRAQRVGTRREGAPDGAANVGFGASLGTQTYETSVVRRQKKMGGLDGIRMMDIAAIIRKPTRWVGYKVIQREDEV
jgi:hypothetical protein